MEVVEVWLKMEAVQVVVVMMEMVQVVKVEQVVRVEQVMVAKVEVVLVLVGEKEKRGEHHPSWRRTAASPHRTAPDASPNQEVAREEGGEGGPAEHWRLPQFGGRLLAGCGEPLLLRHGDGDDDQELVARMVVQLQTGATQSPA